MDSSTHRVSVHAMYYRIARDKAKQYRSFDTELTDLQTRGVAEEELSEIARRMECCYEEREQSAVISITFAGMSLEAFFYDYAAERLGDEFVVRHLDKLDLKSKFLIYPRLVCGQTPDKSKSAYSSLRSLVSLRNDLVHFKSQPFRVDELHKAADFHADLNERLKVGVDNAVNCVMLVMDELDRLHGGGSHFRSKMQWFIEE